MNPTTVASSSRRQFLGGTLAAVTAAGLLADSEAQAQQGAPFVLVHEAWHGGWCWRRVSDRLTTKGRYIVAPTLSGVGEPSHLANDSIQDVHSGAQLPICGLRRCVRSRPDRSRLADDRDEIHRTVIA
jgi:hypothetical protein